MRARWIIILTLMVMMGLAALPASAQVGLWTAAYFNNADLAGVPVLVWNEPSPSHNWDTGSPSPLLPADFFSARWTSVQNLGAGTYQITVRADDGVRVFVNGTAYINEWRPSPGNIYTAAVTLPAGQHTFVVEYFEATGAAYLQYDLKLVGGTVPPASATATVTTAQLNVRHLPNPFTGTILTRIFQGQTYPVVGKNADASWLQLNVNGLVGWVNARYVTATNLQNVPVTDGGTRPTNATATVVTGNLNVRHIPNPFTGIILARISLGQTYPVIGKNADASWLQLNVNGVIGWVNARYVTATNLQNVPVTDSSTRPTGATATVVTGQLNVRQTPNPITGIILTRISLGETYPVVGRNAAGTWVQLNVNGIIGWVNARYVTVTNFNNVPVTG